MVRLNRNQLIVCWIVVLLISFFIVMPAFQFDFIDEYKSEDGRVLRESRWLSGYLGVPAGFSAHYDEKGTYIRATTKNLLEATAGRKYYYVRTDRKYYLANRPYERFIIATALVGFLLFITFNKPSKSN